MKNQQYDKMLVCPECSDLSNDPYECINCHQTFCKDCSSEVNNYCRACNKTVGFEISKLARRIINDTDVNCKYCDVKHKKGDSASHFNVCIKYVLICKHPNCNFSGSKSNFMEHIIVFHKDEIIDRFSREQQNEYYVDFKNQGLLNFQNGTKQFVKTSKGKHLYSTSTAVKNITKVVVKFSLCEDYNYCMVGFSEKKYNGEALYLGGETGKFTWGLAGNGSIGEEGKWNKAFTKLLTYTEDEITLNWDNGKIQVMIGNKKNTYFYNLGIKEAYLTVGLFHANSKVQIISDAELGQ